MPDPAMVNSRQDAIGAAYQRLQDRILELDSALDEAVSLMKSARGHYGIEECAGPGRPATEWDEIQEAMQMFVWRWGKSERAAS